MLNSSPVSIPMNLHCDSLPDPTTYRKLIGKLIYLMNTRPDITYVVNQLSQYVSAPTKDHQQVAFRVLRYLKGTVRQGILFNATREIHLKAYNDSNWIGYTNTRRSVTGMSSILKTPSFPGNQRSRPPFPKALLKLNIGL